MQDAQEVKIAISSHILDDLRGMFYRCNYDEQWTMTFVTKGCKKLTGYEPEELLNNSVIAYGDLVHPDDAQALFDKCTTNLLGNKQCLNEYRIIDRYGDIKTVWEKATGIYGDNGTLLYIEGYITDSTERKERDEIINELFLYRKAIDVNTICSITDEKGVIIYANRKFCEVSRYAEKELLGRTHSIVNSGHHPAAFFADMWKTILGGKVWLGEIKNKAKDGSFYWVDTVIIPIHAHSERRTQYLSLRTVITERKDAEERDKQYMEALEKMLDMLSHGVRQPVVTTLGLIGLADVASLTKEEEKMLLQQVKESVEQIEIVTRKLNEFIQTHKR